MRLVCDLELLAGGAFAVATGSPKLLSKLRGEVPLIIGDNRSPTEESCAVKICPRIYLQKQFKPTAEEFLASLSLRLMDILTPPAGLSSSSWYSLGLKTSSFMLGSRIINARRDVIDLLDTGELATRDVMINPSASQSNQVHDQTEMNL
ncbi:hypothetical protein BC629DRAFT_1434733 [Irpex lacteus]|nr:hypothetical protein BC629DRAFT_1434733 [Irpex lacteus]